MDVSFLDIINNISYSNWALWGESFFVALYSIIIFFQDTTKRNGRFLLVYALIVLSWCFTFLFLSATVGTSLAYGGLASFYFVTGLVVLALFFMIDAFSGSATAPRPFREILLVTGLYLILSIGFLFPGLIVGYEEHLGSNIQTISLGKLFFIYALFGILIAVATFEILLKRYKESAGIFRLRMNNFLLGFGVAVLVTFLGLLFSLLSFYSHDLFGIWFINGALFLLLVIGYLIVKYDFLNPKIIATELFILVIVTVLLTELFIAASLVSLAVKTVISILIIFASFFLVESVKREIRSRDRISHLLRDLDAVFRRLKTLDRKKSDFLSIASEHLRDPLTAIRGYTSMLIEGSFGGLTDPVKEAIEKIFISSEHLIMMVSDFLNISRIESGEMNYRFTDVDMKKIVVDLVDTMKQGALYANIDFQLNIENGNDKNTAFFVVGDEMKLRQVISNLIDNSIKYTPQGGIRATLSRSTDGKKILFTLSDTGIGMSPETIEKLFKKFSRAEGVSRVYTEGTGLGLYVAKEIVKKHEGRIWAESDGEGKGSTFSVELEAKR